MNKKDADAAARALSEHLTERFQDLHEKIEYLERVAGVLRASNAHLRKKLDIALLERDEARESRNAAIKQRDLANERTRLTGLALDTYLKDA